MYPTVFLADDLFTVCAFQELEILLRCRIRLVMSRVEKFSQFYGSNPCLLLDERFLHKYVAVNLFFEIQSQKILGNSSFTSLSCDLSRICISLLILLAVAVVEVCKSYY